MSLTICARCGSLTESYYPCPPAPTFVIIWEPRPASWQDRLCRDCHEYLVRNDARTLLDREMVLHSPPRLKGADRRTHLGERRPTE